MCFFVIFCVHFLAFFQHMVFTNDFLIPIKELGLLTNSGQWIRGFGCHGILYMYFIFNDENIMNRRLEVWL
jgi:hypothetical protein